ncbi:MAG: hypothetical protein ACFFCS_20950 [Candidatus Hodarchaeota archaeon]
MKRIPKFKILMVIGIIGWIYYLLILVTFFNYITVLMLAGITTTLPTILLSFRAKNRSNWRQVLRRRLLVTGFGLGLITFALFANVTRIPGQVYRRFDRCNTLVTPDNVHVNQFRQDLFDNYGNESVFRNASLRTQLDRLDTYTQEYIVWTEDIRTVLMAGDAKTPEEAILSGKDDCRGQACVMASVLIGMDIDAWVVEMAWHWWVMVYDENGTEYKLNHDGHSNNTRQYPILMMWNDEEIRILEDPWGMYNGVMISSPALYGYLSDLSYGLVTLGPAMGLCAALFSSICMGDYRALFSRKNKNTPVRKEALKRFKLRFLFGALAFSAMIGILVIFYFTPLYEFIGFYFFVYTIAVILTLMNLEEINYKFFKVAREKQI